MAEIDLKRRQAVMARSRKLGHCICNPRQGCPCPMLVAYNVCPCAGERLARSAEAAPLTQLVRKAGCASKIGQAELGEILKKLPPVRDPRVLMGTAAGDDAGIFQIDEHHALVQTVDVFTPCVDDAYLFGQIAAANSVSDVYAMGGTPLTALSIVGFPIEDLDGNVMAEMLRGGCDKLAEAGCSLIGGHSINDEEIKCGFAITGLIPLDRVVARDAAQPGDVLVLTKPLGTGMVAFAAQLGLVSAKVLEEAGASMAELNRDAAELMVKHGAHACTDITGFGLAGHLVSMVRGSGVVAEIDLSALPVFAVVDACVRNDVLPGAVDRNQAYALGWVTAPEEADARTLAVLFDPQTSGGLLIALPEEGARALVAEMHARGHGSTAMVGRILPASSETPHVVVINPTLRNFIGTPETIDLSKMGGRAFPQATVGEDADPPACCEGPQEGGRASPRATPGATSMEALSMFKDFMKEANKPGLIDARAKRLMAIALSIALRCRPCLVTHMKAALQMGIAKAEIDEAASLAIAFGGCSAMMFYNEVCEEVLKGA